MRSLAEVRANADAIRNQLALEFGAPRLTFYVVWDALLAGLAIGFVLSILVVLLIVPYPFGPRVNEVLLALTVVSFGSMFALEYLHPVGRRQIALAKGLRKGTMKRNETPPAGGSS